MPKRRQNPLDDASSGDSIAVGSNLDLSPRDALSKEFPDDARLHDPVIYSLPPNLLKSIDKLIPKFFSEADLKFEQRLRQLAGTVLIGSQPVGVDFIDDRYSSDVSPDLYGDVRVQLHQSVEWDMHRILAPEPNRETVVRNREELLMRSRERQQGFAGWLINNVDFRREANLLANEWNRWPRLQAQMPCLHSLDELLRPRGTGDDFSAMSQLSRKASDFLIKWNLTGMASWNLPIPVAPVQTSSDALPRNSYQSMGTSIFIPWWMLADQDLKLREVIDYHRNRQDLAHLERWTYHGRKHGLGVERSAKLLQLYLYFLQAIGARYPDRIHRKLTAMDRAFAAYWNPMIADNDALRIAGDAVRKIREELLKKQTELSQAM